jgi:hypothetical protein
MTLPSNRFLAAQRRQAGRLFCIALLAAGLGPVAESAVPAEFSLPGSGCPMAHCDSRMSDAVNATTPGVAAVVHVDRSSAGAVAGLGCVSNGKLAACTGGSDPALHPNLVVYNADGKPIWDDGGILGSTAWSSAAMISADGQVIAVDQQTVLRADPVAKKVIWRSSKPDTGKPISPVVIGATSSMLLLATMSAGDGTPGEVSVWDLDTGALLSHQAIVDPSSGRAYVSLNTPAVSGSRAYLLTSADADKTDGRLYAVDICESQTCGGRGTLIPVWHYNFAGPSGSSPLLIGSRLFFDGDQRPGMGNFFALDDLGDTPLRAWSAKFTNYFSASAAQDPRGGLWVYPWQTGNILRLNEATGAIDQTVEISPVLGLDSGYSPVTAVTVSHSDAGAVVLTLGVRTPSGSTGTGPHVAAIDVSSAPAGSMLWKFKVSPNQKRNSVTGQFPIVVNAAGSRRVVVRGTKSGTYFIGEP